jgi:hypothetical protein
MDVTVVTEANIDDVKDGMPIDMGEELRPGCLVWNVIADSGEGGWMAVWPDTDRGAICWGGNSIWGDWDDTDKVLVLDEEAADGRRILVHEDGTAEVVDQPWW